MEHVFLNLTFCLTETELILLYYWLVYLHKGTWFVRYIYVHTLQAVYGEFVYNLWKMFHSTILFL